MIEKETNYSYEEEIKYKYDLNGVFLVAQLVKNLSAMQETLVQFLGWEDLLEKRISYPLQYSQASLMAQLVKNLPARTGFSFWVGKIPWRREWVPTPVLLPGESMDYIAHRVTKSQI